MNSAIIVAAGSSRRMGFDKLMADLNGLPVILHSIRAFQDCLAISEILLVTSESHLDPMKRLVAEQGFSKVTNVLLGGAERHHSVWAGLQALNSASQYVGVHDGARPLITPAAIQRGFNLAEKHKALSFAHPVTDTLKRADAEQRVASSVDRNNLWAMETPQIFDTRTLISAYEVVIQQNLPVTDEVSAVENIGTHVYLEASHSTNLKVTFPNDLEMAKLLLKQRNDTSFSC